jgi:hypothetical protein
MYFFFNNRLAFYYLSSKAGRETREIHEKFSHGLTRTTHGQKKEEKSEEKNFDKKFLVILGALVVKLL